MLIRTACLCIMCIRLSIATSMLEGILSFEIMFEEMIL